MKLFYLILVSVVLEVILNSLVTFKNMPLKQANKIYIPLSMSTRWTGYKSLYFLWNLLSPLKVGWCILFCKKTHFQNRKCPVKRFFFSPCAFMTLVLLSCAAFHSTVMKTWWTLITWPSVLAPHWCLSQRYRIKCPARLMWMRLSKPSSSTMRLFSQMLKSWMALFMRNVWLETSIGKSKNFSPSFSSWKKL